MNYALTDQIDQRLPLYQRLRDEIASYIARNTWRPGELIPTEAELAKQHGIAVGTVRRAIDTLVADGLVERQQGRGTFVRRPRFDQSLLRFFRYGRPNDAAVPRNALLSREAIAAPPDHVTESLLLEPGQPAIRISRLRSFDVPFLREEIWLPHPQFAPLLRACPEEIGDLLYPAYEHLCGVVVARGRDPDRRDRGRGGFQCAWDPDARARRDHRPFRVRLRRRAPGMATFAWRDIDVSVQGGYLLA